jgi:hypothetical protein
VEFTSWPHTPPWRDALLNRPMEILSLTSRPLLGTNGQTIETKQETKLLYAQNKRCRSSWLALNRTMFISRDNTT